MPPLRYAKTRANVVSYPIPAVTGTGTGKNIEAGLKPIVKSMSDLDSFMNGMVGRTHTFAGELAPADRVVSMEFHHGRMGLYSVGPIHLDFVVVLRVYTEGAKDDCKQDQAVPAHRSYTI